MDKRVALPNQLSAHLRSLRKAHGLTQAQLGQRLGVKQVRVAEIEKAPGSISVEQLMQVLSALGSGLVLADPKDNAAAKPPSTGVPPSGQW